jgi:hypothetical protein
MLKSTTLIAFLGSNMANLIMTALKSLKLVLWPAHDDDELGFTPSLS